MLITIQIDRNIQIVQYLKINKKTVYSRQNIT